MTEFIKDVWELTRKEKIYLFVIVVIVLTILAITPFYYYALYKLFEMVYFG